MGAMGQAKVQGAQEAILKERHLLVNVGAGDTGRRKRIKQGYGLAFPPP